MSRKFEGPRIITADCSAPREIDDGLFVDLLDEEFEMYRVGVCVADTSEIYRDRTAVKQAHDRAEAKYWPLPGGEHGYDPMLDPAIIKDTQLKSGRVLNAMIVTFTVGSKAPPDDVAVSFGEVLVENNYSYKVFAKRVDKGPDTRFGQASALVKKHLGYVAYGDHEGVKPAWIGEDDTSDPDSSASGWKRGSKINESFMVATNHLVGKLLAEEGRPAIYRVHDPTDEQHLELLSASVARFSWTPGIHSGLNLDTYCRVTSPLRRLDDFVMNRQLKKRFLGLEPTAQDAHEVGFAVRRLNQEIVAKASKDAGFYSRQDIVGRAATRHLTLVGEAS